MFSVFHHSPRQGSPKSEQLVFGVGTSDCPPCSEIFKIFGVRTIRWSCCSLEMNCSACSLIGLFAQNEPFGLFDGRTWQTELVDSQDKVEWLYRITYTLRTLLKNETILNDLSHYLINYDSNLYFHAISIDRNLYFDHNLYFQGPQFWPWSSRLWAPSEISKATTSHWQPSCWTGN